MSARFDKERDKANLARLDRTRQIAVAAAALDRMRVGYAIWAPTAGGRASIEDLLRYVWEFVVDSKPPPPMQEVERLYPSTDGPATLESPYAESFLEAFQLFADFALSNHDGRLVEIRQAAYNMAFDAAGDATLKYNAPGYDGLINPEREQRILAHPWVSRELDNQSLDVRDAAMDGEVSHVTARLRERADATPVVSYSELEAIRAFQARRA